MITGAGVSAGRWPNRHPRAGWVGESDASCAGEGSSGLSDPLVTPSPVVAPPNSMPASSRALRTASMAAETGAMSVFSFDEYRNRAVTIIASWSS